MSYNAYHIHNPKHVPGVNSYVTFK